jgi:hypothetical protein
LEITGSNLHLTEKRLSLTPRDEWQTVANQRLFEKTPVFGTAAPIGAASETANFSNWRMGRDSNPGRRLSLTRFPSVRNRPLCHPS